MATRACFRNHVSRLLDGGVVHAPPCRSTISPSPLMTVFRRARFPFTSSRICVRAPRNGICPAMRRSGRRIARRRSTRRSCSSTQRARSMRNDFTSASDRSLGRVTSTPCGPTRTRSFRAEREAMAWYTTRRPSSSMVCSSNVFTASAHPVCLRQLANRRFQEGWSRSIGVETEGAVGRIPRLRQERLLDPHPAANRIAPARRKKLVLT